MRITKAKFITSAPSLKECPELNLPEFALIGRSNVGKSTFINSIVNIRGLAKTSNTPGKTKLINFFNVNEKFNIKTSTVFAHLKALQRKNQLTRSSKARSIALRNGRKPVPHMSFLTAIPLLGRINAGMPADAQEYRERDIYVESALLARFPNDKFFALRVSGESMRDLGVLDGDIVIVRQTENIRSGDMVVALIGNEATVKSYFPLTQGRIELRPANPDYSTQVYRMDEVVIQGKVVGLQREYC